MAIRETSNGSWYMSPPGYIGPLGFERLGLEERENLAYPGCRAVFKHEGGDWGHIYDSGGELCRSITFKNVVPIALMSEFSFLGYWDGSVKISIQLSTAPLPAVETYFQAYRRGGEWMYITDTSEELQKLFRIIEANNEIPASHTDTLRQIVKDGRTAPISKPPVNIYNVLMQRDDGY